MRVYCAPSCLTCAHLSYHVRCPFDEDIPKIWEMPGDLNAFFERIVSNPYYQETFGPITIVSSPTKTNGPWIVTLDNFLTQSECSRLIEVGVQEGFRRSEDMGKATFYGSRSSYKTDERTSTNAWCTEICHEDSIIRPVLDRIENLTDIPDTNHEWLQLLKYEPGQYYREHHDFAENEVDRPQGPRIVTVFLYLSDVEAGGGTRFGRMNLTIMPKLGRALLWSSVLDEDPMERDDRTHHEALAVEAGIKYAANAWLHQRDFKTPFERKCA